MAETVKSFFNETQNEGNQNMSLNVTDLSTGNYYLQLTTAEGTASEQLIIVK